MHALLGIQLSTDDEVLGALNLYAGTAGAFTREDIDIAEVYATHATNALTAARHLERPAHGPALTPHDRGRPGHLDAAATTSPWTSPSSCCAATRATATPSSAEVAEYVVRAPSRCRTPTADASCRFPGYREAFPHSPEVPRMQLPLERGPISRHVIETLAVPMSPCDHRSARRGARTTRTPSWRSGSSTSSTTAVSTACRRPRVGPRPPRTARPLELRFEHELRAGAGR